ncbi:unnamed protein product [Arabidopsis halleri]
MNKFVELLMRSRTLDGGKVWKIEYGSSSYSLVVSPGLDFFVMCYVVLWIFLQIYVDPLIPKVVDFRSFIFSYDLH